MAPEPRENETAKRGLGGRLRGRRPSPDVAPEAEPTPEFESWMPPEEDEEAAVDAPPPVTPEPPEPQASDPALREDAVRAYCAALLQAPDDAEAATDALATFAQATAAPASGTPEEELLLAITRLMVAVTLPDRSSPAQRRAAVRASIGADSRCTCRESGVLLAARSNGTVDERGARALDLHLAECAGCRELRDRLLGAEERFRSSLAAAQDPAGVSSAAAPRR